MNRLSDETPPRGRGPASPTEPVPDGSAAAGGARAGRIGATVEWLIWLGIAFFFYRQTALFDEAIANYRFGATGWPRTLAVCVAIGATGQLLYRLLSTDTSSPVTAALAEGGAWSVWLQRIGILVLPLIWLWTVPRIGFYVATPVFIATFLLILEVRSIRALAAVTTVVYGLLLLIFTRYFYVALPIGRLDGFYEVNNWIVATVRWGV